jgi:HK97 family phage prohead protease
MNAIYTDVTTDGNETGTVVLTDAPETNATPTGMRDEYTTLTCDLTRAGDGDDSRVRRFVASTAMRDRYGDEILVEAWDTKHYMSNPVFLWAHDYSALPLGRAVAIERTDKALMIDVRFAEADANPLAEQVLKLYDGGFMRAVSVGFRSKASEWIDPTAEDEAKRLKKEPDLRPGKRFTKVELLELSAVPVPANPQALMQARKKGLAVPEARHFTYVYAPTVSDPWRFEPGAGGAGGEPVRAAEEQPQPNAAAHVEGHAETGKDELSVSTPSPDAGQPEACAAVAATLLEVLVELTRNEQR